MPSKSRSQQNTMRGVAHDPAFAKKMGIPQSVGKDYVAADKKMGVRFQRGGRVAPDFTPEELEQIKRIQQQVLDAGPSGSTPPPPPSGSQAAVPINPGGMGMRGGKAGGFWYQNGGTVLGRSQGSFAQGGPPLGRTGSSGGKKY